MFRNLTIIALVLFTGACSDDTCSAEPAAGLRPATHELNSFATPYATGYRGLIGVPGESKTMVNADGTLAPAWHQAYVSEADRDRVVRIGLLPNLTQQEWTLSAPEPGYPAVEMTVTTDVCDWSIRVFSEELFADAADPVVADIARVQLTNTGSSDVSSVMRIAVNAAPNCIHVNQGVLNIDGFVIASLLPNNNVRTEVAEDGMDLLFDVPAGATLGFDVVLPKRATANAFKPSKVPSADTLLSAFRKRWDGVNAKAATVTLPDPWYEQMWRASVANVLLLRDRRDDIYLLKPGPHDYNRFWYRDAAYLAVALDMAGLPVAAEESLRVFWRTGLGPEINSQAAWGTSVEQRKDGRWEAPDDEWDGPGQALWALSMHAQFTRDDAWLNKVWPAVDKGTQWLQTARRSTMTLQNQGKPESGLLPEGFGEAIILWGHVLYHNYWGVAGFREAAVIATRLGKTKRATKWLDELAKFSQSVIKATKAAYSTDKDGGWIPAVVGKPETRIWGAIAALYPGGLLAPHDPMMTATFETMWRLRVWNQYRFFDDPNKIWTYITADWALALLIRDEWQRAEQLFDGYRQIATPLLSWWEEYFVDTRVGTGDCPHGWAAGQYVMWLRGMLVNEQGRRLDLLRGLSPKWFVEGKPIEVKSLPTRIGMLELLRVTTTGNKRHLVVELKPFADVDASKVQLRLFARGAAKLQHDCTGGVIDGDHVTVTATQLSCTLEVAAD